LPDLFITVVAMDKKTKSGRDPSDMWKRDDSKYLMPNSFA